MIDGSSKKTIFVGMSGGVDSSVSAALLKKAGFNVVGVFIKVWQPDWIECNWKEERREAMRAAAHLDIPLFTLDLEKEYKRDVIDYMIREYRLGRTPNPDVMCNRYVKFGVFWKWAKDNGAGFIATGHYARISDGGGLLAGKDVNKDQSYFLWTLTRDDLKHVMFPVGHLLKTEVRKLAMRFGLPNASKKDSQGLCFMGKIDLKEFLSRYIEAKEGDVLDTDGRVIGRHHGAFFFTIGERHGFVIDKSFKTTEDLPYFVVSKDVGANTITVSNKGADGHLPSAAKFVRIGSVNWISAPTAVTSNSGQAPMMQGGASKDHLGTNLSGRSRYRQLLEGLKIVKIDEKETTLEFDKPQDTLTAGQSLVIYDGDECLGGGIIIHE